jgi:hypothetical protein
VHFDTLSFETLSFGLVDAVVCVVGAFIKGATGSRGRSTLIAVIPALAVKMEIAVSSGPRDSWAFWPAQ